MKTLIFFLMCCLGSYAFLSAQQLPKGITLNDQQQYDYHIKKKKQNITVGLITAGAGAAMILGGLKTNMDSCLFSDCDDGKTLSYAGVGVALSSIYFFERAGSHKKRAKLLLETGAAGLDRKYQYSGLTFRLSF